MGKMSDDPELVELVDELLDIGGLSIPFTGFLKDSKPKIWVVRKKTLEGWPQWLADEYMQFFGALGIGQVVALVQERKLSEAIWNATGEYSLTLAMVVESLSELPDPPEPVRECLEMLLQRARADIDNAIASAMPAWKRERDAAKEGKKRGHAAYGKSWLDHWDDAWAVRRDKDNGWKVRNKEVLAALPHDVPMPDRSTITRQRKKRHKELNK